MRIRNLVCLAVLGFILSTIYYSSEKNVVISSVPLQPLQLPAGCAEFETTFRECGNNSTCGRGESRMSSPNGRSGIKGIVLQDVDCEGTSCGSIPDQPIAVDNPLVCCDEDRDGFINPRCGGNDCDDLDSNIHPGAMEGCFNGRDDNCNGLVDNCPGGGGGPGEGEGLLTIHLVAVTRNSLIFVENAFVPWIQSAAASKVSDSRQLSKRMTHRPLQEPLLPIVSSLPGRLPTRHLLISNQLTGA